MSQNLKMRYLRNWFQTATGQINRIRQNLPIAPNQAVEWFGSVKGYTDIYGC